MPETPENNKRLLNFRPLAAAAVGFVCGVVFAAGGGIAFGFGGAAALVFALVTGVSAAVLAVMGVIRRLKWIPVICAAFLLGCIRTYAAAPPEYLFKSGRVTGVVVETDIDEEKGRAELLIKGVTVDDSRVRGKLLLKLPAEAAEGIAIGDEISVSCDRISVPSRFFNNYDERLSRLAEGTELYAWADTERPSVLSRGNAPAARCFAYTRRAVNGVIQNVFGENAPLVSGFILGIKDDIPEAEYSAFITGGVAHILTLSGFHVGLLTGLLYLILPKRFPWLRFFAAAAFLFGYCAVAGFASPLVRASLMCLYMLFAVCVRRRADLISSVSLAALILLLINPFKLFTAGFQLSFAATLGIAFTMSLRFSAGHGKALNRLVGTIAVSFGATAATLLFSARFFGHVYPYNLITNIVCVPLLSAAIVLSFILTAAGFVFPGVCARLAAVPNTLIDSAKILLRGVSTLPYADITALRPSALSCVLMLLIMLAASDYLLRRPKARLKYCAASALLFTASLIADIIRA